MARDVKIYFRLSEKKKEELEEYAERYGVTNAALIALIVGQWLDQQKRMLDPIISAIGQQIQEVVAKEIEKNFRSNEREEE